VQRAKWEERSGESELGGGEEREEREREETQKARPDVFRVN
jgi:hypothetical protein